MSIFDLPGAFDAAREWNEARAARDTAKREYEAARDKSWRALVRMAQAHKRAVEIVGPENAHAFMWMDELDGNRDQIIESTAIQGGDA